MRKRSLALLLSLLCAVSPLASRQDPAGCGVHAEKAAEQSDLHRRAAPQREKAALRASVAAAASRDIGNIAVLEDGGDIVAQPLTFNLELRTVSLIPLEAGAGRYRFETGVASYNQDLAARGTPLSGLDDDDAREVVIQPG
jgi:hypothetical protein